MRAAVIGMVIAIGLCSGCATVKDSTAVDSPPLTPVLTKGQLGQVTSGPHVLFGGDLVVWARKKGLVFTLKDGREIVFPVSKSARIKPDGHIGAEYSRRGGAETFGDPIQGDHYIFDKDAKYIFHVFEKGTVVRLSGSHCESAVFDSSFSR